MSSRKRSLLLACAIPAAAAFLGCAREARQPAVPTTARTTTTTTTVRQAPVAQTIVTPAPTAIGGGPVNRVHTDGPQRLDPARADRMMEAKKEQLHNDCYTPSAGVVSFILDVTIAPDGRVESAETASVNGDNAVAECVRARVEKMTFPQTTEGGVHSFTFLFGR